MTQLAERTKLIKPSVTLAIAAKAGKLRAEGVDVVNFSAGEPDFDTPENIKAAAIEALRRGMLHRCPSRLMITLEKIRFKR